MQTKKDKKPNIKANLNGKSENGKSAISKKPVNILYSPNLDFPFFLSLLS